MKNSDNNDNFKILPKRSLARFVACQALCMYYDKNNDSRDINSILTAIIEYYVKDNFSDKSKKNKYIDLKEDDFTINLIEGVIGNHQEFDLIIEKFLQKQDTIQTLDDVILQSFRLAIFELKNHLDIDKNVIVNEYVDIIAEFYDGVYVTFANGVLDNMASFIRDNKVKKISNIETKKLITVKSRAKRPKLRKVIALRK